MGGKPAYAGFVDVSLGNKPCALGRSGFPPTLLAAGTSLWRSLSQHSLGRHLFFLLHKARVYTSDFLTVQTYTEVLKQQ